MEALLACVRELTVLLLAAVAAPVVVIALHDLACPRHEHRDRLRMTCPELNESEGDPVIRSRLREHGRGPHLR